MPSQRFKKLYICQCLEMCSKQNLQPGANYLGFVDWKSQFKFDAHQADLLARRVHNNPTHHVDSMVTVNDPSRNQGKKN